MKYKQPAVFDAWAWSGEEWDCADSLTDTPEAWPSPADTKVRVTVTPVNQPSQVDVTREMMIDQIGCDGKCARCSLQSPLPDDNEGLCIFVDKFDEKFGRGE